MIIKTTRDYLAVKFKGFAQFKKLGQPRFFKESVKSIPNYFSVRKNHLMNISRYFSLQELLNMVIFYEKD